MYSDDLNVCLGNELVQFADFVNAFNDEQPEKDVERERERERGGENFRNQLILKM